MHDGRFSRIERLIGTHSLKRLNNSFVTVVGLGAVGSYAVEGLARAGIGRLRIVDFDTVKPSNINRQLFAMNSTLDRHKTHIARERVLDINPKCNVESMETFVHSDTLADVLNNRPDLVIDAIDSLNPKVELLTALQERNIPVVSAMGAALRRDPLCVRVGPMHKVYNCPLAAFVRKRLRRRDISLDFTCVYSIERPLEPDHENPTVSVEETPGLERGRKRQVLGSLPTITGIFGLTAANTAIQMLTSHDHS